jgi:XTP/dITP diphosphohydrolase
MIHLTLATRNGHKTQEFASALEGFSISDLTGRSDIPLIDETGRTFEENAILKAETVSHLVQGLVISDDSGLEVAALNGAPGVYSARYAGENATDGENVEKLLRELSAARLEAWERQARFVCLLALAEAGKILNLFRGTVEGRIVATPAGEGGFGYDPIFAPKGYDQTFAELSAVKDTISHRARAIVQLRQYLDQQIVP